jgi:hypothetical protein
MCSSFTNRRSLLIHLDRRIQRTWYAAQYSALDPLFTFIILLVQNATSFAKAVPTRRTGAATTPSIGIAKHIVVVNVIIRLPGVGVEEFPHGPTVVTNQSLASLAPGETRLVAHTIIPFTILTHVLGGKNVKISLQIALLQFAL